jgi:WD40 repeat protein
MPAGTEVRRLSVPSTWVNDVAFSPDGTLLLAGSRDGWLRAYSTVDWGLIYEQWAAGGIEDLVISPDGRMVATGRADGRVGIWELVQ